MQCACVCVVYLCVCLFVCVYVFMLVCIFIMYATYVRRMCINVLCVWCNHVLCMYMCVRHTQRSMLDRREIEEYVKKV